MTILATALAVVAALVAATSFGASFMFWAFCKKMERSWTSELPLENQARWKLESTRTRWALVSIIGYAISMALTIFLKEGLEASQTINMTIVGLASAGILIVSLRAMVHNDRSFEAYLKRRYPNI